MRVTFIAPVYRIAVESIKQVKEYLIQSDTDPREELSSTKASGKGRREKKEKNKLSTCQLLTDASNLT